MRRLKYLGYILLAVMLTLALLAGCTGKQVPTTPIKIGHIGEFTGFAATRLWIQRALIQESRDQHSFVNSPGLIADFHALHRLLTPRHPPCALSSLTT